MTMAARAARVIRPHSARARRSRSQARRSLWWPSVSSTEGRSQRSAGSPRTRAAIRSLVHQVKRLLASGWTAQGSRPSRASVKLPTTAEARLLSRPPKRKARRSRRAVPPRGWWRAQAGRAAARPLARAESRRPGRTVAAPQGVSRTPSTTPATPQRPKAAPAASDTPAGGKRNEAPDGKLKRAENQLASAKTAAVPTSWRAREMSRGLFTSPTPFPERAEMVRCWCPTLLYPPISAVKRSRRPSGRREAASWRQIGKISGSDRLLFTPWKHLFSLKAPLGGKDVLVSPQDSK